MLPSAILIAAAHLAAINPSPVGTWRTIDDETHQARSLVAIEDHGGVVSGRIMRLFRAPGEEPSPLCVDCPGERHNQPVLGMTILWNFHRHGDTWRDGEVLDPEEGRIYRATLRVLDDGKRLELRGYIGVPLLGRSQVWERADP